MGVRQLAAGVQYLNERAPKAGRDRSDEKLYAGGEYCADNAAPTMVGMYYSATNAQATAPQRAASQTSDSQKSKSSRLM